MRRLRQSARTGCGAALLLLCCPLAAAAGPCDEYDPSAPSRSAQITLHPSDFVDESRDAMRSFIATGSIGRVEVAVVSSTPLDVVRAVSAVPQISHFSPHHGEQLKGIAVAVSVKSGAPPVTVILRLRQVCARYFRTTFLYD